MKYHITPKWVLIHYDEVIAATAAFAMTLICSANVFCRYVLNNAISWADEVDVCLLAWVTFVGAAAGYKRNLHYGMDFIVTRLPYKGRKVLRIIINVLLCVTCGFLAYHSLIFTMGAKKVMPYTRLSYKYIDTSAVVGFGSMAVYSVIYLYQALFQPEKYDARYHEQSETEVAK